MLTPFFELSQTEQNVLLTVKIPNLRFNNKSIQLSVNDDLMIFYLSPYYLRLKFNEPLLNEDDLPDFDENGQEIVKRTGFKYNPSDETLLVTIPKKNPGQVFTDLDYVHKLMSGAQPAKKDIKIRDEDVEMKEVSSTVTQTAEPTEQKTSLIEEIDISNPKLTTNDLKKHIENYESATGEEFNWQFKQTLPEVPKGPSFKYGFNRLYSGVIETSVSNGSNDINECHTPGLSPEERCELRIASEKQTFDEEYYMSNYLLEKYGGEDDYDFLMLKNCIAWQNPIKTKWIKHQKDPETAGKIPEYDYPKRVKQMMIDLPKKVKSYDENKETLPSVYYLITAIVYAYNFNARLNTGEPEDNVDSAWVIGKLVPQFSCLDDLFVLDEEIRLEGIMETKLGDIMKEVLTIRKTSNNILEELELPKLKSLIEILIKRSVIYPLFRNYNLISKALEDTYYTLRFGLKKVIEILFETRELFKARNNYYVYNEIYLNDLLNYLMLNNDTPKVNAQTVRKLAHDYHEIIKKLTKGDIVFDQLDLDEAGGARVIEKSLDTLEKEAEHLYSSNQ